MTTLVSFFRICIVTHVMVCRLSLIHCSDSYCVIKYNMVILKLKTLHET